MKKLLSSGNGIYVYVENGEYFVVFSKGDHANTPMVLGVTEDQANILNGSWEDCVRVFNQLDVNESKIFNMVNELDMQLKDQ